MPILQVYERARCMEIVISDASLGSACRFDRGLLKQAPLSMGRLRILSYLLAEVCRASSASNARFRSAI